MKTFDYALMESMHESACKERDELREDFNALNEVLRSTCEELDETKSFLKLVADTCEKAEAEVLALRAELDEKIPYWTDKATHWLDAYKEAQAELAALREQLEYYRYYAAPKPGE